MSMPSDAPSPMFEGRFSDGRSAASVPVRVRLDAAGLEIDAGQGSPPDVWPYGAISVAVPLSRNSIDAVVLNKAVHGQTVFVAESSFARLLADRAPHLTATRQRLVPLLPMLGVATVIAAVVLMAQVLDLSPFRAVAKLMPDTTRVAIGGRVIDGMTQGRRVCEAPAGRAALDKLMLRLTAGKPGKTPFKVTVVDWGLVNAFAVPGEQIVLTRGLITKAESVDEVAGVLAHEIGHGLEMHPETGVLRALGLSAAVDLMMGGQSGTMGNIGIMLTHLNYTRGAERQADDHAIALLEAARISPKGIAQFFRRVDGRRSATGKDETKKNGRWNFDILSTHPNSAERLAKFESRPAYPATPALDTADWQALRDICPPQLPPPAPASDAPKTAPSAPTAKPPGKPAPRPGAPTPPTPQRQEAPRQLDL